MINNISILKNITILYAEDETSLREITLNILKGFTKQQFVAEDGLQGLELFKKYQDSIDIIITDVNMPNMNGLEMVKEIKRINPNIPIIVATAFSNTEYLLEAIDIGVDKYVLKPVDMKKLLQIMSQSLLYHELKGLYVDQLTHFPNRNKLKKDLSSTPNDLMALINIDKFSTLNDLYGEANGDQILYDFSQRLRKFFDEDRFKLYRIEADKFAVISKDYDYDINQFHTLCKDFAYDIEENSIIVEENEIDLTVTIGIAKADESLAYKYAQRVINYARSKFEQIMIYDPSFNIQQSFEENIKWVKQIKSGLKNGNFQAYYQPIVDTQSCEVFKYEALIRYIDEDGTAVSPFKFLEIAKKAKLYPYIIGIMVDEVFKCIMEKNVRVSVNISFEDIASNKTRREIVRALEQHKDYTSKLEFEILESEEINDYDTVVEFIDKVKSFGCKVGVDDFGAGYSNFNMLTRLNIDYVKIDGSLIKNIHMDKKLEIIVQTISNFCLKFGYYTIAEFVCCQEVYDVIKTLDIKYSQGYHFGAPISLSEIK